MEDTVQRLSHPDVLGDVLLDEAEVGRSMEVGDVVRAAGDEVVDPDYFVAVREEAIDQMRAQEASCAGDEHPHPVSPDGTTGGFPIE